VAAVISAADTIYVKWRKSAVFDDSERQGSPDLEGKMAEISGFG
jgi:hypothetical protein